MFPPARSTPEKHPQTKSPLMDTLSKDTPEQPLSRFIHAKPAYLLLFILLLAALSYSNTLFSPLMLDDNHSFVSNSNVYINDFSTKSLKKLTQTTFGVRRLIPILSFAINHKFSRGRIADYHVTNIIIHLLAGAALFSFMLRLAKMNGTRPGFLPPQVMALAAAGLWIANPVQTNAVTYLVQRMASMCAMFYIASLSFYLYGRTTRNRHRAAACFVMSAICALAAFFSKENSATLPIAVLMTETFFISPGSLPRTLRKIKPWQWGIAGITAIILLPPALAIVQKYTSGYDGRPFTMSERLLTESRIVVWYLSLLMVPLRSRMSLEHDFQVSHGLLSPPTTILSIAALVALVVFAWRKRTTMPMLSFGIFWYFLNLAIESTVIPLELVFEHRLYLPSMGIFMAAAAIFDQTGSILTSKGRPAEIKAVVFLSIVSLIAVSSTLTTLRNDDWRDIVSISRDCARKAPNKPRALSELGVALLKAGDFEGAIKYCEDAIRKGTTNKESYFASAANIIIALSRLGRREEALERAKVYLRTAKPKTNLKELPKLFHNMAALYWKNRQYDKAIVAIRQAITFSPKAPVPKTTMFAMKMISDAYDDPDGRRALGLVQTDKNLAILTRMVELMLSSRHYNIANEYLKQAEKTYPEDPKVHKLREILNDISDRSWRAAMYADPSRQQVWHDASYRLAWKISVFTFKYYRILLPLLSRFIDTMLASYPDDRFFTALRLRCAAIRGDANIAEKITAALKKHPDFLPLLHLAKDVYINQKQYDKAIKVIEHISEIYPADGSWLVLELKRRWMENRLKGKETLALLPKELYT